MERIHLGAREKTVNADDKWVQFEDGRKVHYRRLISTIPLPSLIDVMGSLPPSIEDARHRLRANEVVYLNVGIDGQLGESDHWIYVPELKWPVYRVGSFSNANPQMAPKLVRSILNSQIERHDIKLRPVIEQMLVEMGLIECASQFDLCILVESRMHT